MEERKQTMPATRRPLPADTPLQASSSRSSLDPRSTLTKPASQSDIKPPPDYTAPRAIQDAHPALQWIFYISKRFLEVHPSYKAAFYFALVLVCSLLSGYFDPLRGFYFFRKESFLNQWFVKKGWGWTFFLLLGFFGLAGVLESDGRLHKIASNVSRLLVGTAIWLGVTTSFVGVAKKTAYCTRSDYHSRKDCEEAGSEWLSFDMSGHAFLLVYCSLLILEESRAFFKWERADRIENEVEGDFDRKVKPVILIVMRILAVALALLAMLWDGMLVITLIYYHEFTTRLLGVALGVAGWFLTYKVWYPVAWPGLPKDVSPLTARN